MLLIDVLDNWMYSNGLYEFYKVRKGFRLIHAPEWLKMTFTANHTGKTQYLIKHKYLDEEEHEESEGFFEYAQRGAFVWTYPVKMTDSPTVAKSGPDTWKELPTNVFLRRYSIGNWTFNFLNERITKFFRQSRTERVSRNDRRDMLHSI